MPVGHKEALRTEEVGVCAGADLGRGPVEFVDGGFGGWECCERGLVLKSAVLMAKV